MTAEKDVQVARKRGRGEGGEVIWAMPERKHSFLKEVFPNTITLKSYIRPAANPQPKSTQQNSTLLKQLTVGWGVIDINIAG